MADEQEKKEDREELTRAGRCVSVRSHNILYCDKVVEIGGDCGTDGALRGEFEVRDLGGCEVAREQ